MDNSRIALSMEQIRRGLRRVRIFACLACAAAWAFGAAQGADPRDAIFREMLKKSGRVKTIDAGIEQHIRRGGNAVELFRGRYRADSTGRFRIDFHYPDRQIVVNSGNVLSWYYPGEKLLYRFGDPDAAPGGSRINPLAEFARDFDRDYDTLYLGRHLYGFLRFAHMFVVQNRKNNSKFYIWVDEKDRVVMKKSMRDRNGVEVVNEYYDTYTRIGEHLFPTRIDVIARTAEGLTRNTTFYSNVRLNVSLPASLFRLDLPRDVRIHTMRGRQ